MNTKQALELANTVVDGRLELIAYLRKQPTARIDAAARRAGMYTSFSYKLKNYPGDLTPAKLLKLIEAL